MLQRNRTQSEDPSHPPANALIQLGLERVRTVGIVVLALGIAAVIAPAVAGAVVSLIIGIVLLAAGLSRIVRVFRTKSWKDSWEDVLLSTLAVLGGGVIVARPLVGLTAITLSLVVYFAISGIVQAVWWWRLRAVRGALWTLLSGLMTLLLAVLIGVEWPLSGLWAVGTLVGVHLILGGSSLVALAAPSCRKDTDEHAAGRATAAEPLNSAAEESAQ